VAKDPVGENAMNRLDMRYYGDTILRKVAEPVRDFDDKLRELAEAMVETMHRERGVGLAAPQVGESIRLITALRMEDSDDAKASAEVLVNPKVVFISKETWSYEEGCLCMPGVSGEVIRPVEVEVEYQDLEGKARRVRSDRFFGRILLHEIDHLNGVLFIDYFSSAQKSLIKSKLKEISESKHLF
jgi:peptide deformylase